MNNHNENTFANMEFTGERVIPNMPELTHLYQEHIIRYMFASQFVKSKVVLDAACGTGYGSYLLYQKGAKTVIGIDISKEAIDYCNYNYKEENLEFKVDDCMKCHLDNSSFDVVVSFETLEHLKNPDTFLSEIKRVMKNDGMLIMSTPNKNTYPTGNPFHFNEYTETEFRLMLEKYFVNVTIFHQFYPPVMAVSKLGQTEEMLEIDNISQNVGSTDDSTLYFVAVCSDNALLNCVEKIFLFKNKTILQEEYPILKESIHILKNSIHKKNSQISELENKIKLMKNKKFGFNRNDYVERISELEELLKNANLRLENVHRSIRGKSVRTYAEDVLDKLYREILMRPPDELAIKHYLSLLLTNKISEEGLRKILMDSEEANLLYRGSLEH